MQSATSSITTTASTKQQSVHTAPVTATAASAADTAPSLPANYVRPIQAMLNGYRHYRLEVRRMLCGHSQTTYPDISWPQLGSAEYGAADYAHRHDLPLLLDDDPDGRFAQLLLQQVAERDQRQDLETLWMG